MATGHDPAKKKTGATATTYGSTYDARLGSKAKPPAALTSTASKIKTATAKAKK